MAESESARQVDNEPGARDVHTPTEILGLSDERTDERAEQGSLTRIDITSLPEETPVTADDTVVQVHAHVLAQLRQAQRYLLSVKNLPALVRYLLKGFPGSFTSTAAELHLHDPEGLLDSLMPARQAFGEALTLHRDSYALYQFYPDTPLTTLLDFDDPRMFELFSGASEAAGAVVMPLLDDNRLIGSYHLALVDTMTAYAEQERELFAMLADLVAATLQRVLDLQRADRLMLLDPVTEVGNLRAFRRDMLREILWARRVEQPLSLLFLGLDDLDDVGRSHGEVASHFVQRRVSQRLSSYLRSTDYMAHISDTHFAVLLPACNELHAHDIGERMRADIDGFAIDDGRGAVLYVTLSIGMLCWEPARHPMDDSERLATQMQTETESAMQSARRAGGNRLSVARLGLLMI